MILPSSHDRLSFTIRNYSPLPHSSLLFPSFTFMLFPPLHHYTFPLSFYSRCSLSFPFLPLPSLLYYTFSIHPLVNSLCLSSFSYITHFPHLYTTSFPSSLLQNIASCFHSSFTHPSLALFPTIYPPFIATMLPSPLSLLKNGPSFFPFSLTHPTDVLFPTIHPPVIASVPPSPSFFPPSASLPFSPLRRATKESDRI